MLSFALILSDLVAHLPRTNHPLPLPQQTYAARLRTLVWLALSGVCFGSSPQDLSGSAALVIEVPSYPNVSCPIMGKPISTKLFTDVPYGRIWICCKGCVEEIQADVELAYRTAYPSTRRLDNERCPWTGTPIKHDSPRLVLQGFEFAVASPKELELSKTETQITLARLHNPKLVDVGNHSCPVTATAVEPNAFVIIDGNIVRLSTPKVLEQVRKDPRGVLLKAREIRAQELEQEQRNRESGDGKSPC